MRRKDHCRSLNRRWKLPNPTRDRASFDLMAQYESWTNNYLFVGCCLGPTADEKRQKQGPEGLGPQSAWWTVGRCSQVSPEGSRAAAGPSEGKPRVQSPARLRYQARGERGVRDPDGGEGTLKCPSRQVKGRKEPREGRRRARPNRSAQRHEQCWHRDGSRELTWNIRHTLTSVRAGTEDDSAFREWAGDLEQRRIRQCIAKSQGHWEKPPTIV
ncbi:hypothetical protein NDU88_001530 [Pleurodeles waltl]|uniref:Uncharacterized protein n=1 Tax=Pleurodeles waltl TaxID=8319 RepID=A0AAV7SZH6_PLEWA|nr:hypothetical protein NDU88_001530 [Pleurodeles waltl]